VTIIINKQKTRYQRKLKNMNKLKLLTFLLLSAIIIQGCKKDTVSATAYTTAAFQADIDGSTWAPDSISTTITYSAATKSKVFNCIGTKDQKRVNMTVTLPNSDNSNNFVIGNYAIDAVNTLAEYDTQVKNSSGTYVFLPHGTVASGSGSINITAIDVTKNTITGTFFFYSRSTIYDSSGNVVSIDVDNITGGEFTAIPYTFSTN
jgi:hypothetical protein